MNPWHAIAERWNTAMARRGSTAARGERCVACYLKQRGYRVLATNLRTRRGEIDIVAEAPDRRTIAIVEVKSCARRDPAHPPEMRVGPAKRRRLVALAAQLVRRYDLARRPIRFDIAGVNLDAPEASQVRYHAGAFESHV